VVSAALYRYLGKGGKMEKGGGGHSIDTQTDTVTDKMKLTRRFFKLFNDEN